MSALPFGSFYLVLPCYSAREELSTVLPCYIARAEVITVLPCYIARSLEQVHGVATKLRLVGFLLGFSRDTARVSASAAYIASEC